MNRLLRAYRCRDLAAARSELSRWFTQPLGQAWHTQEQRLLSELLDAYFGYHLLQVGRPQGEGLCSASRIPHRIVLVDELSPGSLAGESVLLARGEQLPLESGSVDVVVLPHTLPFAEQPHTLLREVERVLIPEGRVIILGFNPWSLFGLRRLLLGWRGQAPWCGHFYSGFRVRDWLSLLGFDSQGQQHYFYRPPLSRHGLLQRLAFLERWGARLWPILGGGYVLVARKRVTTLTPIRPRWRSRRLINVGPVEPTARRERS